MLFEIIETVFVSDFKLKHRFFQREIFTAAFENLTKLPYAFRIQLLLVQLLQRKKGLPSNNKLLQRKKGLPSNNNNNNNNNKSTSRRTCSIMGFEAGSKDQGITQTWRHSGR